jgi:hypothetical protein
MVASPSDVPQERILVREVIAEWNTIHAKDRRTVLMHIGWESHATPEMGDRPQAIINSQLLKEADLLVAIFWTRIGTPTGAAKSGTVEEIEEHIRSGKPTMIYFSSVPVRLDSIDESQYDALKTFRESLRARGLFETYDSLAEFESKFRRQLAQKIISNFSKASDSTTADTDTTVLGHLLPRAPQMGAPARQLLAEAAKDQQGVVMNIQTLSGAYVQTNGRNFVQGGPREEAQWRGAVRELERLGLVEDRAGKGEVFFVTDEGYRTAEILGG